MLRLEMFLINVESLMPDLQNLWSEFKLFLLSEETLPVLLISKAVTVVLMCVISVAKCAYLFVLSVLRCEMFTFFVKSYNSGFKYNNITYDSIKCYLIKDSVDSILYNKNIIKYNSAKWNFILMMLYLIPNNYTYYLTWIFIVEVARCLWRAWRALLWL